VNHYAFGNTFLTESILYRCVRNVAAGRFFAGNAFETHQKRGVIRV
jgi:hypothetical protein